MIDPEQKRVQKTGLLIDHHQARSETRGPRHRRPLSLLIQQVQQLATAGALHLWRAALSAGVAHAPASRVISKVSSSAVRVIPESPDRQGNREAPRRP